MPARDLHGDTSGGVGDPMPADGEIIQIATLELGRLFSSIDPSPFRERDLDPDAEEFIVGWAREAPANAALGLLVHLRRPPAGPEDCATLREAVHEFFAERAAATRRQLRLLLRRGRTSLLIGLAFLGASIGASDLLAGAGGRLAQVLREGLVIGGWVAMWRPLEIFLYEWWPIRAEARLFDRLATMPVRVRLQDESQPRPVKIEAPH